MGSVSPLSGLYSTPPTVSTTTDISAFTSAEIGALTNRTGPSPSGAGCSIVYTVDDRPGETFFVDGRSVVFPVFAFGQNDRVVQLTIGLTGLVGQGLTPPLTPTETVDVSLNCSAPGPVPPPGQPVPVPVKATSWSVSGIGVNAVFDAAP